MPNKCCRQTADGPPMHTPPSPVETTTCGWLQEEQEREVASACAFIASGGEKVRTSRLLHVKETNHDFIWDEAFVVLYVFLL